ncbi:hypothetical protein OBBRIDRAFT_248509 [Obba rivulosa]|uniref:Uncharacterized protein n=1 Tax=Obba rivulosa TaxID=1052685 RepID=A0A8E2AQJ9_9APHY|nr:hypothetical protein OBBRIDRAFT_248509 [Obba rivulosa]
MPPSYSPCPRPILKRPSASPVVPSPASPLLSPADGPAALLAIDPSILQTQPLVHFAPNPALARTHSAAQYDRSPIVVMPNRCALPERGCPGRTYVVGDEPESGAPLRTVPGPVSPSPSCRRGRSGRSPTRARSPGRGRHMHPRAVPGSIAMQYRIDEQYGEEYTADADATPHVSPTLAPMPLLVPDLSSSDESDGFASPPAPAPGTLTAGLEKALELETSLAALALHSSGSSSAQTRTTSPRRTSFLPHPHLHQQPSSARTRAASRSPPRPWAPASPVAYAPATPSSLSASPPQTHIATSNYGREPQKRARRTTQCASAAGTSTRYKAYLERSALAGIDDGGCLGGF